MLIGNPNRRLRQQASARIDWAHPLFAGASRVVIMHSSLMNKRYDGLPGCAIESMTHTDATLGPMGWSASGASAYASFAPVITSRHTLIYSGSRTQGFESLPGSQFYYGFFTIDKDGVGFGTGASAGPTTRREYTFASGKVVAIVPDAAMTNAPKVFVDGRKTLATYASGTGSTYGWGSSSVLYNHGWSSSTGAYLAAGIGGELEFFYAIGRTDIPDAVLEDVTADPLSIFLSRRIWVPVSAAAPTTFNPAWARNSNTVLMGGRV